MRLMFLAQDRGGVAYPTRVLSKTVSLPTEESWAKLKRCVRYLIGKQHYAILLPASGEDIGICRGVSDSDWATDLATRKSVSCGTIIVGGCTQGLFVRGQDTVATSSGVA